LVVRRVVCIPYSYFYHRKEAGKIMVLQYRMGLQVNHITFTPYLQSPHRPSSALTGGESHIILIITSGDRFMNAHGINDLFEGESPAGQLYVRLKETGIRVEREWWIDEGGTTYIVDLALPTGDGWLPVTFGERPGPTVACVSGQRMSRMLVCGTYLQVKLRELDIPVKREWLTLGLSRCRKRERSGRWRQSAPGRA
jgi:hypothetical protein